MGGSELVTLFYLVRRSWFFLLLLGVAAASAAIWEHNHFQLYNAKTVIYYQSTDANPLQALTAKLSGENASGNQSTDFPEKYLQLMMSYPFALEAANALSKSPDFKEVHKEIFFRRQNVWDWFSDYLFFRVSPAPNPEVFTQEDIADAIQYWVSYSRADSGGVNISINTPELQLSLLLANIISETAVQSITNQNLKELNEAEKYLNQEISSTEQKLDEVESSIVDFKRTNKLVTIDEGMTGPQSRLESTKQELEEVEFEIDQNKNLLHKMQVDLHAQESRYLSNGVGDTQFGLARRVRDLEERLNYFKTRRTSLKRSLASMVQDHDPHSEQKVFNLKKRVELEYSHFQDLERQVFQVELQRISAANKISILAPVRAANITRTVSLTKKLIISLVFAMIFGIALARLQEFFSPVVKSREDLENLSITFLAAIPDLDRGFFRKKIHGKLSYQTFRHICTRLLHLAKIDDRELQVISVLSPILNDGKSFISKNLGSAFAQSGKKTLVIDMGANSKFGGPGLVDVLRGQEKFAKVCLKNVTPGLDLLPGGVVKDDLSLLLNSSVMAQLMNDIRSLYSYVIIDTISLSVSVDSVIFSNFSDASVVIAVTNQTSLQDIERLTDLISDTNEKPVLGILNRFPGEKSSLFKPIDVDAAALRSQIIERS